MTKPVDAKVAVVIPNWNGADHLQECLDSLQKQSVKAKIIVVDNGSTDGSRTILEAYSNIEVIWHDTNKGYAGGVNPGFRRAIELNLNYVAAFNNDAGADKNWLKYLVTQLGKNPDVGIAACKLLSADGKHIDSTGDYYTVWGLPYPRGREEKDLNKYDEQTEIFGASGGASLYRVAMLEQIGLFDEDFFAYYEDVDLSFRAQLAGWKVHYVPQAIAYHQISATSNKIKGFATYQTMKNLQLLWYKNVPRRYFWKVGWRFTLASSLFLLRAISRGQGVSALTGDLRGTKLLFNDRAKRRHTQSSKKVSDEYIWNLMTHDLPPNAHNLRRLRRIWWRLGLKRGA